MRNKNYFKCPLCGAGSIIQVKNGKHVPSKNGIKREL